MDDFVWIAFLAPLGILAVGFIIYLAWRSERKRTEALRQTAQELGFQFTADDLEHGTANRFASLRLFSQGHSRKVANLLRGAGQNAEVSIFDYKYTVGSGKNKTTHRQTVVCFESPELDLPEFELRPEHLFHRIGGLFGYQDIDFGDYPEFSRKYLLRGTDEPAIRERFDAAVVERIERLDRAWIEGNRRQLVFYRQAKRARPEEIRPLLEEAFGVFALVKGNYATADRTESKEA